MNVWEQLLIAFGGNAMLLAVLGLLARSLLQTWLTKDIKKFEADLKTTADSELERLKAELKAKGDASIEELKNRLQLTAFEHQVRFSNLHEKRAEIIAELYSRAVRLRKVLGSFLDPDPPDLSQEMLDTQFSFSEFFDVHRIYLPESICSLLSDLDDTVRLNVIVGFVQGAAKNVAVTSTEPRNYELAIYTYQIRIPQILKALEDEFRTMLGVEHRSAAATQ